MKKDVLSVLLTCVVVGLCASYLIPSSPWSVTSKVIVLTLSSFVCLSVVSLAIQGWLDILNTTNSRDGSNRLRHLVEAEKRIAARGKPTTSSRDIADYKNFTEDR